MSALANDVLDDLLTALRIDHSDVGGTYDLTTTSNTPRVIVSDSGQPSVRPPLVILSGAALVSDYDSNLTEHGNEWRVRFAAWAAAATDSPEARIRAGQEIAADVVQSIQRAHRTTSFTTLKTLTTLKVSHDAPSGGGENTEPQWAVVEGEIRYRVTSADGA